MCFLVVMFAALNCIQDFSAYTKEFDALGHDSRNERNLDIMHQEQGEDQPAASNSVGSANDVINNISLTTTKHDSSTAVPRQEIEMGVTELEKVLIPPHNNSQKWLIGPRLSNVNGMPDDLALSLIMDGSPLNSVDGSKHILSQQSFCPDRSKFLHWQQLQQPTQEDGKKQEVMIETSLVVRLMYLAMHEHQHKPARAEALARQQNASKQDLSSSETTSGGDMDGVGNFDFECEPDTKYIVTAIPSNRGFGVGFRAFGIEPLMLGLLTNRVSLFMNSLPVGPQALQNNFFYSDCKRKDMQCMFMPLSPCVLTHEDMTNAVQLPHDALLDLRRTGILNETYANEKVLVVESNNLHTQPKGIREAFINKITSLYNRTMTNVSIGEQEDSSSKPWNLDDASLQKVKDYLLDPANIWTPWIAAAMYALRPNSYLEGELDGILQKSVPEDFDPTSAIGIPIRGTYVSVHV